MSAKDASDAKGGFGLPPSFSQSSSFNSFLKAETKLGNDGKLTQLYVDPAMIQAQCESAKRALETQVAFAKENARVEYESEKLSVMMRFDHEFTKAAATIEQSRQEALFALERQHHQRRIEIEQKAQQQRLQIEATANEMIMQTQQQKLQREYNDRFGKGIMPTWLPKS